MSTIASSGRCSRTRLRSAGASPAWPTTSYPAWVRRLATPSRRSRSSSAMTTVRSVGSLRISRTAGVCATSLTQLGQTTLLASDVERQPGRTTLTDQVGDVVPVDKARECIGDQRRDAEVSELLHAPDVDASLFALVLVWIGPVVHRTLTSGGKPEFQGRGELAQAPERAPLERGHPSRGGVEQLGGPFRRALLAAEAEAELDHSPLLRFEHGEYLLEAGGRQPLVDPLELRPSLGVGDACIVCLARVERHEAATRAPRPLCRLAREIGP